MNARITIFFVFLLLYGLMGGYYYINHYQPNQEKKAASEEELAKIQKEIGNLKNIERELAEKEAAKVAAMEEYNKWKNKIQTRSNIPEVLRSVEDISLNEKVKFVEIRVDQMVPFEGYHEIPIELQIVGPYHDTGRFLRTLEGKKLFNVNGGEIQLTPHVGNQSATKQEISMVLRVKSYILNEGGAGGP